MLFILQNVGQSNDITYQKGYQRQKGAGDIFCQAVS
jgi:hypothetical protein